MPGQNLTEYMQLVDDIAAIRRIRAGLDLVVVTVSIPIRVELGPIRAQVTLLQV